ALKIPLRFNIQKLSVKKSMEKIKYKIIPTNLRENIIKYLEKHSFFLTLDLLIEKLKKKGYRQKEIEDEIELMKTEKTMRYGKVDVHAWSLSDEEIEGVISKELNNGDQNSNS
ncbi:MAG: hypothetical protein ACFFAO_00460, partial [Candidatus Hermodarchaeota archaeon]